MERKIKNQKLKVESCDSGSALLVALLVMGILLTLSLGVSELLVGTLRDSRLLIEQTHAWYAAEAGLEHALADINSRPPGFETTSAGELTKANFEYRVKSLAARIPPQEEGREIQASETYATLHYNKSVTIPLFSGPRSEDAVKHFRVEYFLSPHLQLKGVAVDEDLDILRWKIFGTAADGTLEVINEFLPANRGNSAQSPTCFGTSSECYNGAKFYERRLAPDGATEYHIVDYQPIAIFLENHTQNFLVLTNIVNTDLIAGSISTREKQSIATIRYRITEEDGQRRLTMPIVYVEVDGRSGTASQSLNLELPREEFLPVFNYALYRTTE